LAQLNLLCTVRDRRVNSRQSRLGAEITGIELFQELASLFLQLR
jgi:hypothetical protein